MQEYGPTQSSSTLLRIGNEDQDIIINSDLLCKQSLHSPTDDPGLGHSVVEDIEIT